MDSWEKISIENKHLFKLVYRLSCEKQAIQHENHKLNHKVSEQQATIDEACLIIDKLTQTIISLTHENNQQ